MCFSAKRNVKEFLQLFSADDPGQAPELQFLYGLKFATICFITYDHRVVIFWSSAIFNAQKIEQSLRKVHKFFLPHGDLLVDTFFFIGGVLCSYLLFDTFKKRMPNPFVVIFARFLR